MPLPIIPTITRTNSGFEAERPILKPRAFTSLSTGVVRQVPLSDWGAAVNACSFKDPKQREKMPFTYLAMHEFQPEQGPGSLPVVPPRTQVPPAEAKSVHESGDVKPKKTDPKFTR